MKLTDAKTGTEISLAAPGFPMFTGRARRRRIVTSDFWEYLRYISRRRLNQDDTRKALAFIDQAFEFYSAAANPLQSSRPLLYYYSFLNLGKVLLLCERSAFPPAPKHGISDPRANQKQRLHFKTQVVRADARASSRSALFAELVYVLSGGTKLRQKDYKVLQLLGEAPSIHRTYSVVTGKPSAYVPIETLRLLKSDSEVWCRIEVRSPGSDISSALKRLMKSRPFKRRLKRVKSTDPKALWFQSKPESYVGRELETKIAGLAARLRPLHIHATLTPEGYRLYFLSKERPSKLPQACIGYAAMFYLGSLTRYKPYDYDKITSGYSWLISEFLDTQPVQFLALLAGAIAKTEVVLPFSVTVRSP